MCIYILFPVVLGIIVIILSYHPEIGPDSLLCQQIVIDFFPHMSKNGPSRPIFVKTVRMIIFMLFPEILEIITIILGYHPVLGLGSFKFQGIIDFFSFFFKRMALLGQFLKNSEHDYFHIFFRGTRHHYNHFKLSSSLRSRLVLVSRNHG